MTYVRPRVVSGTSSRKTGPDSWLAAGLIVAMITYRPLFSPRPRASRALKGRP